MKSSTPFLSSIAAAILLASLASAAPSVQVVPVGKGARLLLNGKLITFFRTPNGSLSAQKRAELAASRLQALLETGLKPAQVQVRPRGEGWALYAGSTLLMIATPEEAAERNEDAEATVRRWATNLRAALGSGAKPVARADKKAPPAKKPPVAAARPSAPKPAVPAAEKPALQEGPLAPAVSTLLVPVGEARVMSLRGAVSGPLTARTDSAATATVQPVPGKEAVEVRGVGPGRATVEVQQGGQRVTFVVNVAKYAGRVTGTALARVTGEPTPGSLVRRAAEERVLEKITREPGTIVRVTGSPEGVKALGTGAATTLSFPITITGEGYLPVKSVAQVRVTNQEMKPQDARVLLYSNDPESVREYGTLFEGLVEDRTSARLMFHHQNRMGKAFTFEIHLINPGNTPADVQVIGGDSGPFIDPIQVGHRAAQKFMDASLKDVGYVTTIPPRGVRTIYGLNLPDLRTVSGIYNIRVLNGGDVVTHVSAMAEPTQPEISDDLIDAARSEPDIYPTPQKVEKYSYTVGSQWTFMPLGRKPIPARAGNKRLAGNYGVLYNLTVDLSNPTSEEKTIRVLLMAEAGWTRGVFVIDGKVVEAPQLAPPSEAVLWTVKLAPQEKRQVQIQGIPIGGSAYPVSLVVRS